ncbi:MAG: response regulator [Methanobacterium sp. ERen5]|nr:MAG: response regulator [Methanobacterium sp. ERen5]
MEKTNILVVEDENILALGLKKKLENLGYAVTGMADSGEETFRQIEANVPDLILMDIVIKGEMDGIETAAKLKKSYSIPVIYLTAYADDEILKRAARTEPYGYILKPYKEKELKANIEMAIYRKKSENDETFDFEDIYKETTCFINKNEKPFKKILMGSYFDELEVSVDVGTTKLYISAARNQQTSDGLDVSEVLSRIAFNYVEKYGGEALIYPKGDEICLELDKPQF